MFIIFLLHLCNFIVTFIFLYNIYIYIAYILNNGGVCLNNKDVTKLLEMLSKMDKSDLEKGLTQASEILGVEDKNKLIDKLKDM